ncbi:hypothetical protein GBAR_LOCUS22864 [Geodia barretti]|uniref:Uncharacterized protein n=1 Tax=Geodia barretti TaxID=519541 RepID=A0AA35T3K5_GEOBA|nr:hypothetical protein GBAR_LOCUS22864 [Geodia barretti]
MRPSMGGYIRSTCQLGAPDTILEGQCLPQEPPHPVRPGRLSTATDTGERAYTLPLSSYGPHGHSVL